MHACFPIWFDGKLNAPDSAFVLVFGRMSSAAHAYFQGPRKREFSQILVSLTVPSKQTFA
jgi:hypothetical protein